MDKLFCISAGQLLVKKSDNKINKRNLYLNYGLLSLATTLKAKGWNPIQIQGNFENPIATLTRCIENGLLDSKFPLLISIPSFYAISWVNEFIERVKVLLPTIKIIVGGRWVIGDRVDLMQSILPNADIIVPGIAEDRIGDIVKSAFSQIIRGYSNNRSTNNYTSLNYDLLFDRHLYQPSVEVSRGCGMGCNFCQEKDEKLQPLKHPSMIESEVKSIVLNDGLIDMNFYYESSMFVPSKNWLRQAIQSDMYKHKWRTETRVDSIQPSDIKTLANLGLKVLDLGLESASKQQLIRMNKSSRPDKYLDRASSLMKEASSNGISLKVNILLTAGETEETLAETMHWLEKHKEYICGVSVGPEIVFGWPENTKEYLTKLEKLGATVSHSPAHGITHLNLSKEIDYEKSIRVSKELSRRFMNHDDFFFLKSFSYFSRNYTYDDFVKDIKSEPTEEYSFCVSSLKL